MNTYAKIDYLKIPVFLIFFRHLEHSQELTIGQQFKLSQEGVDRANYRRGLVKDPVMEYDTIWQVVDIRKWQRTQVHIELNLPSKDQHHIYIQPADSADAPCALRYDHADLLSQITYLCHQ